MIATDRRTGPRRQARYGMIIDMAQEPIKTPAKAAAPAPPAEPAEDAVEKFLTEQKALEAHRHDLIKELLRQKEAAMKEFDDKLEKLGYESDHSPKRTHHKRDAEKKTPA